MSSPDNQLVVTISNTTLSSPYPAGQRLYYRVNRAGQTILENSPLGIVGASGSGSFTTNLIFVTQTTAMINDTYQLTSGKQSTVTGRANELTLTFRNAGGQDMDLVIRVYDDGTAFRYRLRGSGAYAVTQELTGFRLPLGAQAWAQIWHGQYEKEYLKRTLTELEVGKWGHPILISLLNNHWLLITEAASSGNYATLHFRGAGNRFLEMMFPPDQTTAISGTLPLETPWRVVLVGERLEQIVEANLFTHLSPVSQAVDTSWIKPGRAAWSWWADPNSPRNLAIQKQYVDFAQEMGWEYILIDEGWNEAWIPDIVTYARERGVDILLWYIWSDFTEWTPQGFLLSETRARQMFDQLKTWGIKGIKLDFLDSDSQERLKFYDLIYRLSAEYQMVVNFHGATKPDGETRTWPQLLTREAVKGAEYLNFPDQPPPTALHNIALTFTRNILGPMDYTPVVFSNRRGGTTLTHELALAVIFESGLTHFPDAPSFYRASPGKEFLKIVPVTWDETRFIAGHPDTHVVLARRKGQEWFIGAASVNAQTLNLPLDFLNSGFYQMSLYRDGVTSDDMVIEILQVSRTDVIAVNLLASGGAVAYLKPTSPLPSVTPSSVPSDVNGDGLVNAADVRLVLGSWINSSCGSFSCDLVTDGKLNLLDLGVVIANFGK